MSTSRILDAEFIHIPPPPPRDGPTGTRRDRGRPTGGSQALLGALAEASLVGMAALAFAWGLAELAFVLAHR